MKDIEIKKTLIERFLNMNTICNVNYIKDGNSNVALPNKTFEEPANKKYYRLSFFSDTPESIGMYEANLERYYGFLQIDVCSPLGVGEDEADVKYATICKLFETGKSYNGVEIEKVYKTSTLVEDNLYRTIIRVNFTADVDNN